MKALLFTLAVCFAATSSRAAIIQFDLIGTGGTGLLFTSEPGVLSGGSGGETGAGISFDDVSKILTINVGWGSASGFTDLTGSATNAHVHGPTASSNGDGFTETAGVLFGLTSAPFTYNNSATNGSIVGSSAPLDATSEGYLFDGRLYINVHTGTNPGGEIRGFLVQIPEPSAALLGAAALGLTLRRRRD